MRTVHFPTKTSLAAALFLVVFSVLLPFNSVVSALSQTDLNSLTNNTPFYDPTASPDTCTQTTDTTNFLANPSQKKLAQIIIGIAKTDGLGQKGALIGLMAGLAESHLQIYANQNVPLSLSNPNKQAIGSDHDSLGILQQRPSMGWSTIATGDAAINNKAAVDQLMDPAYNAEAFFGSPPGANAPAALSKGLQNHKGWQSMDPWMAAQAVQGSMYADGSNYKAQMSAAQSLLSKLWDSSQPVALPVPLKGVGGGNQPIAGGGGSLYILGDSLSVGMAELGGIKQKLSANGWDATVNGYPGRTLSQGLAQVQNNPPALKSASAILVELGTNDYSAPAADFNQSLSRLYNAVHAANPPATIYWMNYTASKQPWQSDLVQKTNLLAAFAKQNNITVIDWAGSGAAEFTTDDTDMGIHPLQHYPDLAKVVVDGLGNAPTSVSDTSCTGGTNTNLGTGTGKFTDNTSVHYPGIQTTLARAKEVTNFNSALFHQICTGSSAGANCFRLCAHLVAGVWNKYNSSYSSAATQWRIMVSSGHAHPGDRNVPVGALLFYDTGDTDGHVALYLGNNLLLSNDVNDYKSGVQGGAYIVSASAMETGPWQLTYLGWSDPIY